MGLLSRERPKAQPGVFFFFFFVLFCFVLSLPVEIALRHGQMVRAFVKENVENLLIKEHNYNIDNTNTTIQIQYTIQRCMLINYISKYLHTYTYVQSFFLLFKC